MTRMSKKGERRAVSPRKHKKPSLKTGARKDNLPSGFHEQHNALAGTEWGTKVFVPKLSK